MHEVGALRRAGLISVLARYTGTRRPAAGRTPLPIWHKRAVRAARACSHGRPGLQTRADATIALERPARI